MITLSTTPNEKGTAIFTLVYTDEDENVVVPATIAWQLMRSDGTVVNDRTFANCSFSGTTVVLSGDDLQIYSGDPVDNRKRIFAIQATYNSSAGTGLPMNDEVQFKITNLVSQE